jgi:hypothetical protein
LHCLDPLERGSRQTYFARKLRECLLAAFFLEKFRKFSSKLVAHFDRVRWRGGIGRRAGLKIQQLPILSDYLRLKANRDFHRQNELLVRIVAVSRGCHKKAESRTKVEQRGSVPSHALPTRARAGACPSARDCWL